MVNVFLPGDIVLSEINKQIKEYRTDHKRNTSEEIKIGYGIEQTPKKEISSNVYGSVVFIPSNKFLIPGFQRKYNPISGDCVVGVIVSATAESYLVDIGHIKNAILHYTSFEDATKRKKIRLKIGSLIYANVIESDRNLDVEISCVDENKKQSCYGELKEGTLLRCKSGFTRFLLSSNQVLSLIGKNFSFEIAIGLNGRIWINSDKKIKIVELIRIFKEIELVYQRKSIDSVYEYTKKIVSNSCIIE